MKYFNCLNTKENMKNMCRNTAIWKNKVKGLLKRPSKHKEIHGPLTNFYPGLEKLSVRPRNRWDCTGGTGIFGLLFLLCAGWWRGGRHCHVNRAWTWRGPVYVWPRPAVIMVVLVTIAGQRRHRNDCGRVGGRPR